MVIVKIELYKYLMFGVHSVSKVIYTPSEGLNVILGGNGAGKSKLLYELNPLPISKKMYGDDGYKKVWIEYDNNNYVIYSDKHGCSFKEEDKELNINGLHTTQVGLCSSVFSIDNDIRNLGLGEVKLTDLTTTLRKKWFTRMSSTDYSFAISLYDKMRSVRRDLRGSVKLLSHGMTESSDNIPLLKDELTKLHATRDRLLVMSREEETISYSKVNLQEVDNFINSLSSIDGETTDVCEHTIELLTKKLDAANKKRSLLQDVGSSNLSHIEKSLANKDNKIETLENNTLHVIEEDIYSLMMELRETLYTLYDAIVYDDKEIADIHDSVITLRSRVASNINHVNYLLEDKEKVKDITCPKCHFSYTTADVELLDKNLHKAKETLSKLQEELKTAEEKEVKAIASKDAIALLKNKIRDIPSEYVKGILYSNLDGDATMELNQLYTSIDKSKEILSLRKERDALNNEYLALLHKGQEELDAIERDKELLDTEIDTIHRELSYYRTKLIEAKKREEETKKLDTLHEDLKASIEGIRKESDALLVNTVSNLALSTLEVVNSKIESITTRLHKSESDLAIRNFTIQKIEEEEKRIDALSSLIDSLSPDGGLIAESLEQFMHLFIRDMNDIISNIWGYDFIVKPCSIEDGDLDYIFQVEIPNAVVDDVKSLSTGQKEIVDFSFKITALNYLGVLSNPIYLDEVFVNLEPKHKELAFHYVGELMKSSTIGQVFMISHRDEALISIDENTIFLDGTIPSSRLEICYK